MLMPINLFCSKPVLVLLLIVAPLTLNAQDELFDLKKLENFGTKKYKMTLLDGRSGSVVERECGRMILSASQTKDSVSLKNVTRMFMPDGKRFVEYSAECNFSKVSQKMALRTLSFKGTRSDKVVLFEIDAKVGNGKINQKTLEGDEETIEEQKWSEGTIPDLSIFFLIPQLSQKEGNAVSIDQVITFPLSSDAPVAANRITCMGTDKAIKIDGQECTKFVNNWNNDKSGIEYWIDSKGRLRRVLLNPENRLDLILE